MVSGRNAYIIFQRPQNADTQEMLKTKLRKERGRPFTFPLPVSRAPTSLQEGASVSCRTLPFSVPNLKVLTTVRDLNLACGTSRRETLKPSHRLVVWNPKGEAEAQWHIYQVLKSRRC